MNKFDEKYNVIKENIDEGKIKDFIHQRKIKNFVYPILFGAVLFEYNLHKDNYPSNETNDIMNDVYKQFNHEVEKIGQSSNKYQKDLNKILNVLNSNKDINLSISLQDITQYLTNLKTDKHLQINSWNLIRDKKTNEIIKSIFSDLEIFQILNKVVLLGV